ncbi:MAG: hypothetical protein M1582_03855 [Actinobacteria bacterium]|nr:hypothetical protein [Actinomycetota bacterium]
MAVMVKANKNEDTLFHVIHPLFDEPEEKADVEALGPMKMTRSVRYSLMALRVYLIAMIALAFYRVISMGLFGA